MALERELFGDEAWTDAMFWSELAERDTRLYLRRRRVDGVVTAYAGLCAYVPHEAYVQTIGGRAGARSARGLGTALLVALLDEARRRGVRARRSGGAAPTTTPRSGSTSGTASTEIAVRRNYYQPSGTDAIVMRRELASR